MQITVAPGMEMSEWGTEQRRRNGACCANEWRIFGMARSDFFVSFYNSMRWGFFVVLLFLSMQSMADRAKSAANNFDNEYEEKPWAEMEVQLPVFPETENLISFKVGAINDTQYAIDGSSLSVGSDGVIRYTLVVISSTGAKSISYEGVRCATAERRFYAFGRTDNTWSKARSSQWVKIQGGSNNHHFELYSNFFCPVGTAPVTSVDDAIWVLQRDGSSKAYRQ